MANSDKTIDGFAYWIENEEKGVCYIPLNLCEKVLKLLKSQYTEIKQLKAKQQPMIAKDINGTFGSGIGYCPSCGNGMHYTNYPGQLTQHYCDQCGQAVKWLD